MRMNNYEMARADCIHSLEPVDCLGNIPSLVDKPAQSGGLGYRF